MSLVDTHCHASLWWFEPIETLLFQMARCGVDKAVLVQHRGEFDNSYLLDAARSNPGRFSVTALVNGKAPDAVDMLAVWKTAGVEGVRLAVPGPDGAGDPVSLWRKAADLGLRVSTPSNALAVTTDAFAKIIEELADLPIILEHYGFLRLPEELWEQTYPGLLKLSRFPNVYFKVHGFGEITSRPFPARNPPFDVATVPDYLERARAAFGADRLMLATDFPPSAAREGYGNVISLLTEYIERWGTEERVALLGGTAESLFPFQTP